MPWRLNRARGALVKAGFHPPKNLWSGHPAFMEAPPCYCDVARQHRRRIPHVRQEDGRMGSGGGGAGPSGGAVSDFQRPRARHRLRGVDGRPVRVLERAIRMQVSVWGNREAHWLLCKVPMGFDHTGEVA